MSTTVAEPAPVQEFNEVVAIPPTEPALTPTQQAEFKRQHRIGLPLSERTIYGGTIAFATGSVLGASYGARREALRFRAENAHRLPTSQKGWYFYHKSKNYVGMFGGVREGLRMGFRTSFVAVGFIFLEAAADHARGYGGQQDFLSTAAAGIATAALWSAWNKFPAATTVRTGKLGLKIGLGLGLVEDMLGLARGRELAYVEHGKKLLGLKSKEEEQPI